MLPFAPSAPAVVPTVAGRPWWRDADPPPPPSGESVLRAIDAYRTVNAQIRELLARWEAELGGTPLAPLVPLDLVSISESARAVSRPRKSVYQWIADGRVHQYQRASGKIGYVSLAAVRLADGMQPRKRRDS